MKQARFGKPSAFWPMVISIFINSLINAIIIYSVKDLLDYSSAKDINGVMALGKIIMITLVALTVTRLLTDYFKANYLKQSLLMLKTAYIETLMKQDITQLQKDKIATYYSDLTNGFDRIEEKHFTNIIKLLTALIQIVIALSLIALINMTLALVTLLLFMIFLMIVTANSKTLKQSESDKSEALVTYASFIEETLTGFETIQQYQLKDHRISRFRDIAAKVQAHNSTIEKKSTNIDAINTFIQMSVIFAILLIAIIISKKTGVHLGAIVVITSSFSNIYNHLLEVTPLISQLTAISKVFEDFKLHLTFQSILRPESIQTMQQLQFHDVALNYQDYPVLSSVNLTINQNEKVLIIGRSGSGKSSLLKSIHQSLLPSSGLITVNRINIQDINATNYASLFSVVDQIGFIFSGTVKDNVTLLQDIDDHVVQEVLTKLNLQHLPLNMVLQNNGANISGGQRARLMMARALCLNSQVILADEMFASLENDVAQALERDLLSLNKTIINVSHLIFKNNLDLYDKIFIVDNHSIRLAQSKQEVYEQMILMNS